MNKIIFLHGFFASGQCTLAHTLRDNLQNTTQVLTPDLPLNPRLALQEITHLCEKENPDLLVGNSCGSFYGQIISCRTGIPALLGNPYFMMTQFLEERLGNHQYKSPRHNGQQDFTIDRQLIEDFRKIENCQFDNIPEGHSQKVWGLFGEQDSLAHFEPLFKKHYLHSFHFPGAHTPTAEEVNKWYAPLVRQMLEKEFNRK